MSSTSPRTLTSTSEERRIDKPNVAWQVTSIIFAFVGGLVPLSMAIGIAAWGGLDFTIALPLSLCIIGLVSLLIALAAVSSKKKQFVWIGGLSASAIAFVTLLFMTEFLFFRAANVSLFEKVSVFKANVPLIVLYVLSLVSSLIEVLISAFKIGFLCIPR